MLPWNCFLNSAFDCPQLACMNMTMSYPTTLLSLRISFSRIWGDYLGFSTYGITSYENRDRFTSSCPTRMAFISFSCLIALARTSGTTSHSGDESRHLALSPRRGESVRSFTTERHVSLGSSRTPLLRSRRFPPVMSRLSVFIMTRCWIL